jgi:hypothetical protein
MTDKPLEAEHPAAHSAGAHPAAEEDLIHSRTIVFVGVGALVLFFVASLATIGWMKRRQAELLPQGAAPYPAELGRSKIGLLEQRLFENSNQAEATRAAQLRKLDSYGWVDVEKGVLRIPIDRAMELVVKGERPKGEPSAQARPPGGEERPDAGTGAPPPQPQPQPQRGSRR